MMFKIAIYHGWQVSEVVQHAKHAGCRAVHLPAGVAEIWHPDTGEIIFSAQKDDQHCGMWRVRFDPRCFKQENTKDALVKYQSSIRLPWDKRLRCPRCDGAMTRYVNNDLFLLMPDLKHTVDLVGFACDNCNSRCYFERVQMEGEEEGSPRG